MTDRRVPVAPPDPIAEALLALARSALANRRAAEERRAKMAVVGGKRGGRAA